MDNHLIPVQHLCTHYHAEVSFVQSLHDYGLIELTTIEESYFVDEEQLKAVERMIHLHYDLDINIEGIDAIQHLINRVDDLNKELTALRNKLRRYE
ncbi:MerR family transcriptional regulator [Arachidicoccus ginsenosidimutans]|uniref:chaperone modulator CbpM n=1 Tax=Arachidicoccus sp. BS20 TaxID=1850526 RepID=UPI0007F15A3F|nr:chaperone modulator CbpM [Arachidicoccus sp. BS20]ANI87876.1 MerR family transcriptional regulator [Arachidicoccus sp. BS20]